MLGLLRSMCFLLLTTFLILYEVLLTLVFLPFGRKRFLRTIIAQVPFWARTYSAIMGVRVRVRGRENIPQDENFCIIANHMSYMDILFIGYQFPLIFVSKKEVKRWPLLGWMASMQGTVYVDRSLRGKADRPYIRQIIARLKEGFNMVIFPEGTSSNGKDVLPFKKTIFTCPVQAGVPILPVTIRYVSIQGEPVTTANRDIICWYGAMHFADHFWRFINIARSEVELIIHPPIREQVAEDWLAQTKALSSKVYQIVRESYLQNAALAREQD